MQDSTVIERWNPISLAEMAVGVKGVLYRVINRKPHPFDFDESLKKGIDFLSEASDGCAIFCGEKTDTNFTGTLGPLTFTARYIDIDTTRLNESDFYRRVLESLRKHKEVLQNLSENKNVDDRSALESTKAFFEIMASIAMSEADPTSKSISRSFS
jgi:hypothetical protein